MASFKRFPDLPQKLQNQVWDFAIRDDEPSAHILSVYHNSYDQEIIDPSTVIRPGGKRPEEISFVRGFDLVLAAPLRGDTGQHSWSLGNHSAYMEDSGLWTACHDSRDRMLRRFGREDHCPQAAGAGRHGSAGPSVTMEFSSDSGERQYLTICPSADLLCD